MQARSEAEIARDTRWKLPSLNRLGFNEMTLLLERIEENLYELHYFIEEGDETFTNAMDGEDDEEREFRMMFAELKTEAEHIREMVGDYNSYGSPASDFVYLMNEKERRAFYGECDDDDDEPPYNACRAYDDCTVALIGKKFNFGVDGWDPYERDVFGLDQGYEAEQAADMAKKRLMRLTKQKMVDLIGDSISIMLRFQEFYLRYELLTQTFEQIRGANLATLQLMKDIETAYEDLAPELTTSSYRWYGIVHGRKAQAAKRQFDRLLENLPDRLWVE